MFKLAVVIFCAMTFGYAFGRIQQFNIDDLIPVLFIIEKYDEQEKGLRLRGYPSLKRAKGRKRNDGRKKDYIRLHGQHLPFSHGGSGVALGV